MAMDKRKQEHEPEPGILWFRNRRPKGGIILKEYWILWFRNRRLGDGEIIKFLDELIRQPTLFFIFPYTRYFNNEVLKLRFIARGHIVFPYANYATL